MRGADPEFKEAFTKTIESPRALINEVWKRLEWNGEKVQVRNIKNKKLAICGLICLLHPVIVFTLI